MADDRNMLPPIKILDVWNYNFEEVFEIISTEIIDKYPYIAMDTEFPGKVVQLVGDKSDRELNAYTILKENIEVLKLIQVGITLFDKDGNLPTITSAADGTYRPVWQFNFNDFKKKEHPHVKDSIAKLKKAKIDFEMNEYQGVDPRHFGELLTSSGMVLNDQVRWVTFHGGYDFALLLCRTLSTEVLPDTKEEFYVLLKTFFPTVYDIKMLSKHCIGLYGGLESMALTLGVNRTNGVAHQAGSDSLLTAGLYKKVKEVHFRSLSPEHHAGSLCLT